MKVSDLIAECISEMLTEGGGVAELSRKSLADRFSCVPSQINYVIETRFSPQHGYYVESRRGGGGFIRIVRVMDDKQQMLLEAKQNAGEHMSESQLSRLTWSLQSAGLLTGREADLLRAVCSDIALGVIPEPSRSLLRARIYQSAVMGIAFSND